MPNNDWILDVLADLRTFAVANGLSDLADQLEETKLIAAADIALQHQEARAHVDGKTGRFGPNPGRSGRHHRA